MESDVEQTVTVLADLIHSINHLIHYANESLQSCSLEEFIEKKIFRLFAVVQAYSDCFERLNVSTRSEMNSVLKKKFRYREIQEGVEHLEESESAIKEANGLVLVVSFGGQEGAKRWLEDMECSYDMLLDQDRKVYEAFGLQRSVFKVWCIFSMLYYAEQLAAGNPPITPYENVEDDPHQMGGDFMLDKDGHMTLVYCSKNSADRPTMDELITVLTDCNKKEVTE